MNNSTDRCKQLRKLHNNLIHEVSVLREHVQEVEQEGVQNPIETVNIIKHLEETLRTVNLELQKCPPENS